MSLKFRFAILSDPHIALPQTIWHHPKRFHLVEVSIPALEAVLERLSHVDLDFLLIPGDLTQHGEPNNHAWLVQRLAQLPYPVYVIPGNHDVVEREATAQTIGLADFPRYYQKFGYTDLAQPYYTCEVLPGVRLIGLNSNGFDLEGKQLHSGYLDPDQLEWLQQVLAASRDELLLVMLHHNVLEHLPGQRHSALGRRYMLENSNELLPLLQAAGVQLLFTGHLHVQDVAQHQGLYEITTGSLVSYPHPYRVLEFQQDDAGNCWLQIESGRVTQVPDWSDLLHTSREWMGERSSSFMLKLLTHPPLNLSHAQAEAIVPELRYFWADIANGDAVFDFSHLPDPIRRFLTNFGAVDQEGKPQLIDNFATLKLEKA
nr:MAG: metallophosphoesterase [Leptolyngbya sp. IPPAS B-1204]